MRLRSFTTEQLMQIARLVIIKHVPVTRNSIDTQPRRMSEIDILSTMFSLVLMTIETEIVQQSCIPEKKTWGSAITSLV